MRFFWALCVGWLLSAGSAQATTPSLAWKAPAPCPSGAEQRREIERLLGKPVAAVAGPTRIGVVIARSVDGYEARIETDHGGAARTRVLKEPDCAVLSRAVAVVVALTFDPRAQLGTDPHAHGNQKQPTIANPRRPAAAGGAAGGATRERSDRGVAPAVDAAGITGGETTKVRGTQAQDTTAPNAPGPDMTASSTTTVQTPAPTARVQRGRVASPSTEASTTPAGAPASVQAPESSRTRRPRQPPVDRPEPARTDLGTDGRPPDGVAIWLRGGAGAVLGPLPTPAPTAALSGALVVGPWEVSVGATFAPRVASERDLASNAVGWIGLSSATLAGGLRGHALGLIVPVSLGLELGAFDARASGVVSRRGRPLWIAASAALGGELPIARWAAIFARLELLVPLRRPRMGVAVTGGEPVTLHRPWPLGGRALIGLSVNLW